MEENKQELDGQQSSIQEGKKDLKIKIMNPMQYEEALGQERFPMGIIAGIVTGVVCAVLWAAVTLITYYQIGWMAIGVGFVVGFAIRKAGNGVSSKFGVVGAIIALLSCLFGNALIVVGMIAHETGLSYTSAMSGFELSYMVETFSVMDLLFYGLAIAAGYKYAFHKVEVRS